MPKDATKEQLEALHNVDVYNLDYQQTNQKIVELGENSGYKTKGAGQSLVKDLAATGLISEEIKDNVLSGLKVRNEDLIHNGSENPIQVVSGEEFNTYDNSVNEVKETIQNIKENGAELIF